MKLVIAEKPSVGLSIAKVIGAYERHPKGRYRTPSATWAAF